MDIAFDTTWCPTCSRQILPKRIQVPVAPLPSAAAPAPPPCSPTSQTKAEQQPTRLSRNKTGTIRPRNGGGLVHGTGRVKPNGTIKRPSPNNTSATRKQSTAPVPPPSPTSPAQPAPPVRQKTIIDQSPVPLYCSDECRLADMQSVTGIDINYNPERHASPTLPHSPTPSRAVKNDSDDSELGSSLESEASSVSPVRVPSVPSTTSKRTVRNGPIPIGYAALASIYDDLPPCPPPPPFQPDPKPVEAPRRDVGAEYSSGLIMASRRIQAALLSPPQDKKRPSWCNPSSRLSTAYAHNAYAKGYTGLQQHREVIPGWTDGSNKWRASVYSFARPDEDVSVTTDGPFDNRNSAYAGFVSTPLRSRGVYSTMGESTEGDLPAKMQRVTSQPCPRARSEAEELYSKWDMSFTRRCESRTNMSHQSALMSTSPTGSTHSLPAYGGARKPRKEVPILKKGAEGKLLVPDVKLKRTDSTMSFERLSLSRQGSEMSVARSRLGLARTESTSGSSVTEEDEADETISLDFKPKKARSPPMSSSSWYENEEFTYPLMILPNKEKRTVTKVVDGKEVVEEVTVDVYPERKRLFLFPGNDQV
ncbi:hypothetical protein BC835DRAFT_1305610 [Cytidiella melzeri]|nr:hypothetical protein BC835DRAFT_1305610 [Cytidiella melzeri]